MIVRYLQGLRSFGAKVMLMVTITAGIAVIAVSVIAGTRDYWLRRQQLVETIAAQAQIVAANSSAPLAFGDVESASEALSAFRFVESVSDAALVDANGRLFVAFSRIPVAAGVAGPFAELLPEGHWLRPDGFALVLAAADRSGAHGRLQVHYSGAQVRREALVSVLITTLFSFAALLLVWLLARRVKTVLVAPVAELDRTAQYVTDSDDFGARARRLSNDELGRLTDRLNVLLGHVESSRSELIEAHRQAEHANQLKDEFVATLSHELRTPMSPIMAWTHLLRARCEGQTAVEEGLDVIERNALMMVEIINDLLDMSRIISGKLRLDMQAVDLEEIIRAAAETVQAAAESRRVRLQLVIEPNSGSVRGDPARLQQVVWNLLSNAIKFTPKAGQVQVSLRRFESHVEIRVADTGSGIATEFLPYVFDRFRQQDGSMTRRYGGLGLGLSIVKQLVELHGGSIAASSPGSGLGATFVVSLPLTSSSTLPGTTKAEETSGTSRPQWDEQSPLLAGIRVLVVEDQPDMGSLLRTAIKEAGGEVRDTDSMANALDLFDRELPDIIVSDIGMPGGDGYDLVQAIRRRPAAEGGAIPAIALTAYARSEDRTRALLSGYQLHIAKPVRPIELLAAIASLAGIANRGRA